MGGTPGSTGLHDKSGREIRLGDIVDDQFGRGQLFEVVWVPEEARFGRKYINIHSTSLSALSRGTIHTWEKGTAQLCEVVKSGYQHFARPESEYQRDQQLYDVLSFFENALRRDIKAQHSAWFRDAGQPPGNINVNWYPCMLIAQQLLTEIERLGERVRSGQG